MVIPLRRLRLVTQRCDARQITKIMDQMRLIGIAVFRCQRAPVRLRGTAHRAQDSLQAMHTGKPFWSNPHLVGKPARECPGKKTQTRRDLRSEECRVGKECRSGWWRDQGKKKEGEH